MAGRDPLLAQLTCCRNTDSRPIVPVISPKRATIMIDVKQNCVTSLGFLVSHPSIPLLLSLPRQFGELNEVAAGVVQHGNGRASHVGGRHRELGAASLIDFSFMLALSL